MVIASEKRPVQAKFSTGGPSDSIEGIYPFTVHWEVKVYEIVTGTDVGSNSVDFSGTKILNPDSLRGASYGA